METTGLLYPAVLVLLNTLMPLHIQGIQARKTGDARIANPLKQPLQGEGAAVVAGVAAEAGGGLVKRPCPPGPPLAAAGVTTAGPMPSAPHPPPRASMPTTS
mmetsp:Transcript_19884/g.55307  ORF Transcript_19884/g.55307 Transcript_19884/m.55307 type:complete len:102 (-) Transcript_19884:533-838(-)